MKKYLVLLLISTFAFGQVNTTTTTAGKYKMNIPDLGVKKDSAVVWDGVSKLLKIIPVSQIKGTTNLDYIATPIGGTVFSSSGNDAILPLATTINAGLQSPSDKTKLNGIANGATANSTDAALRDRSTHTGTQPISTVAGLQTALDTKVDKVTGKGLSTEDYTTAEKTKLSNIANGATANSTDAALRDRSTHTGTQAISTVIGLQAAIDSKINISLIGTNNGVAPLDAGGKVPFANLPASLMIYKGMWNPTTNTPTLSDGTGVAGWVYKVSVDGSANLGSGTISYLAGDFLIHNGTKWERSAGTDNVVSVNGQQGIVTLTTANIADSTNKRYQTDTQQAYNDATSSIQTQLNGKQAAGSYEPAFSKNTAFNKNFGTTAGTVAEGNDSRINNGQTAYSWGNHANKYVLNDVNPRTDPDTQLQSSSYRFDPNANNPTNHHYSISTFGNNGNVSAQLAVRLSQGDAYTRSYDASWSTWRKLLNDVNFSSYSPTLTGGGATGTWGINISGNASSATNWGGRTADLNANASAIFRPVVIDNNGSAVLSTDTLLKSWLGLSSAITGTGTANFIPKFTGAGTLGNSQLINTSNLLELRPTLSTGTDYFRIGTYSANGLYGSYLKTQYNYASNLSTNLILGVSNAGVSVDAITVLNNGNVLIKKTADSGEALQVNGSAVFSGDRPITLDSANGSVNFKFPTTAFAMGSYFVSPSNAVQGSFGAFGQGSSLEYHYIGADYANPLLKIDNSGNTTIKGSVTASTFNGNLNGVASSATQWGSRSANLNLQTNAFDLVLVRDNDGVVKLSTASSLKTFLNLGSLTDSNYMVIDRGFGGDMNSNSLNFCGKLFNATNAADAYGSVLSFGEGTYITQINSDPTKGGNTYIRVGGDGGGFGSWSKLWHSNNFSPDNYLPLTGGSLSGNLSVTGTVTASGGFFNSDLRLKDVVKRDGDVAYFKWKDKRDNKLHIGYIAQEVQKEFPDQVQQGKDGMLSVNYVEVLVAKIQDLEKRVKELENHK